LTTAETASSTTETGSPAEGSLRVLFSVRPFRGHLHPLIPLARAFARAGHRVAVATAEDVAGVVTGAGLAWIPAGLNPREFDRIFPGDDPQYGYPAVRAKVEDLLDIAIGQFRPHVIVREPTDLAPIIAAEIVGAVNVIYGLAQFIPRKSWRILGADRTITDLRRTYRLPADPKLNCMYRDLYLAVLPPLLDSVTPLPVRAVQRTRYVPWDGNAGEWPTAAPRLPPERPTVLMTLGTVFNDRSDLFRRFLRALGGEDLDVICTLGEGAEPPVKVPANVRFEIYRPHSSILPGCQALLCHGGFNTVMGSLIAGVPLVCVPLGADQMHNARFCAAKGYGVSLDEERATPARIRAAVHRVLEEPSFLASVQAFRHEMASQPGLPAVVRRIERLVARRRSERESGL
jgi:UDP:flavonoid glycosyltransferase YjiC (YdhE family)